MTRFEQMLIGKWYVKHISNVPFHLVKDDGDVLSTLGVLEYYYIKGDRQIIFGLSEIDTPPTLISPLPRIVVKDIMDGKPVWIEGDHGAQQMIRVLDAIDHELIYEAMFDKTKYILVDKINDTITYIDGMKTVIDFSNILKDYGIELTTPLSEDAKLRIMALLQTDKDFDKLAKELKLIVEKPGQK